MFKFILESSGADSSALDWLLAAWTPDFAFFLVGWADSPDFF